MRTGERGNTLVGELVALAIVGAAVMMLLGAFGPSSRGVSLVRRRVVAENLARRQMETIKGAEYQSDYPTLDIENRRNYSVGLDVSYWISTTGPFTVATPAPGEDSGLQCITVTVSYTPSNRLLYELVSYKGRRGQGEN
jgi:type II secretory pathway pseudopilin PulG